MQVRVTIKGDLDRSRPRRGPASPVELPEGADAAALLTACGLDRRGCVVVVNGAVASPATRLRPDDRVQVYAAQAGG